MKIHRLVGTSLAILALQSPARAGFSGSWTEPQRWSELSSVLATLDAQDAEIDAIATNAQGEWMVVGAGTVHASRGFPQDVVTAAQVNLAFGRDILGADCNPAGTCALVHSMGVYANGALPPGFSLAVSHALSEAWTIRDVEITNSGWLILGTDDQVRYDELPLGLAEAIDDRVVARRELQDVAIGLDNSWAMLAGQNPMYRYAAEPLVSRLDLAARNRERAEHIVIGRKGDWLVYSGGDEQLPVQVANPWYDVENNLDGVSLWQRIADADVVGLSIAIVENNQVTASRGYGRRYDYDDAPVLGTTPFYVGSLSKYLGALTTLATLELFPHVDLDTDILDPAVMFPGSQIYEWKRRGETEPEVWDWPANTPNLPTGMTLRRLLSHTAGTRHVGSTPISSWYHNASFSPSDLLTGYTCRLGEGCGFDPHLRAWKSQFFDYPGQDFNYSSQGYMILQTAIEDYTGLTGAQLFEGLVVQRLGLKNTTGEWELPSDIRSRLAWPHNDIGPLPVLDYWPGTFAGGVATSAGDYAEMLIPSLNQGRGSDAQYVVSQAGLTEMFTKPETDVTSASNYGFGLWLGASQISERPGPGFWHAGSHGGRNYARMCGLPSENTAIVVMINSDDVGSNAEEQLARDVLAAYRDALGLNYSCGVPW